LTIGVEIDTTAPDHLLVLLEAVQARTAAELDSVLPADLARLGLRRIRVLQLIPVAGARQQDLADRAGVSKQAMAEAVEVLEEAGLIKRTPDPADGRAWLVRRSARGDEFNTRFETAVTRVEEQFAERLGPSRYAQLGGLLREVADS
jgi:DNA-binding MarR family transcriptional regulator